MRRSSLTMRLVYWAALVAAFLFVVSALAQSVPHHSNPYLLSWIPATCCVTNDCCWEISPREAKSLPQDNWQVLSTGQVLKRTAYSPDGKFYRCACEQDPSNPGKWIRHQGANTRCIFPPLQAVMIR